MAELSQMSEINAIRDPADAITVLDDGQRKPGQPIKLPDGSVPSKVTIVLGSNSPMPKNRDVSPMPQMNINANPVPRAKQLGANGAHTLPLLNGNYSMPQLKAQTTQQIPQIAGDRDCEDGLKRVLVNSQPAIGGNSNFPRQSEESRVEGQLLFSASPTPVPGQVVFLYFLKQNFL